MNRPPLWNSSTKPLWAILSRMPPSSSMSVKPAPAATVSPISPRLSERPIESVMPPMASSAISAGFSAVAFGVGVSWAIAETKVSIPARSTHPNTAIHLLLPTSVINDFLRYRSIRLDGK